MSQKIETGTQEKAAKGTKENPFEGEFKCDVKLWREEDAYISSINMHETLAFDFDENDLSEKEAKDVANCFDVWNEACRAFGWDVTDRSNYCYANKFGQSEDSVSSCAECQKFSAEDQKCTEIKLTLLFEIGQKKN